jgi:hypothetical protein
MEYQYQAHSYFDPTFSMTKTGVRWLNDGRGGSVRVIVYHEMVCAFSDEHSLLY